MLLSLLVLLRGGMQETGARIPWQSLHTGMDKTHSYIIGTTLLRRIRILLPLARPTAPGLLLSNLLAQLPLAQLTPPGMLLSFQQTQLPLA